jgi:hypothetical protein
VKRESNSKECRLPTAIGRQYSRGKDRFPRGFQGVVLPIPNNVLQELKAEEQLKNQKTQPSLEFKTELIKGGKSGSWSGMDRILYIFSMASS